MECQIYKKKTVETMQHEVDLDLYILSLTSIGFRF